MAGQQNMATHSYSTTHDQQLAPQLLQGKAVLILVSCSGRGMAGQQKLLECACYMFPLCPCSQLTWN